MNTRLPVPQLMITKASRDILRKLGQRLEQHGRGSFIGPHETLGILTEEYAELIEAVRSNDYKQVERELIDIAVGCLFGVASLRTNVTNAEDA